MNGSDKQIHSSCAQKYVYMQPLCGERGLNGFDECGFSGHLIWRPFIWLESISLFKFDISIYLIWESRQEEGSPFCIISLFADDRVRGNYLRRNKRLDCILMNV